MVHLPYSKSLVSCFDTTGVHRDMDGSSHNPKEARVRCLRESKILRIAGLINRKRSGQSFRNHSATQDIDCSPDSQKKKSNWCFILGIPPQLLQPLGATAIPFVIFVANGILGIKILVIFFRGIKYRSGSNFRHDGVGKSF